MRALRRVMYVFVLSSGIHQKKKEGVCANQTRDGGQTRCGEAETPEPRIKTSAPGQKQTKCPSLPLMQKVSFFLFISVEYIAGRVY